MIYSHVPAKQFGISHHLTNKMDLKSTYHFSHRQTWISYLFHGFNSTGLFSFKNIPHTFLSILKFEHVYSNSVYLASFLNLMLMFFFAFLLCFQNLFWLNGGSQMSLKLMLLLLSLWPTENAHLGIRFIRFIRTPQTYNNILRGQ